MSSPKLSLAAHIAKLRSSEKEVAHTRRDSLIFWGTSLDTPYLSYLKGCVGSCITHLRNDQITTLAQVRLVCGQKKCNKVVSTSIDLLRKLLNWDKRAAPSLSNYEGSYFTIPFLLPNGQIDSSVPPIEVIFISPLKQLLTVSYGKFMATRYIDKIINPANWYIPTEFKGFELLTPANESSIFEAFQHAFIVSVDIETLKENATIRCLAYTAVFWDSKHASGMSSTSVVLPLEDDYSLAIMQKFNAQLKAPKVLQNGKYDISYLARYNAPLYNYLYDTAHLFHAWYSELPKDLGALNSFFIREAKYWKDLSETNDLHEYYKYNALDTWGTVNAFLAMLKEVPNWAIQNYLIAFPLVFPCHLCEMQGIARDMDTLEEARKEQELIIEDKSKELNIILDVPKGTSFNVNSPVQMKTLLKIMGCGDLTSADEKNLAKARFRHPLNARIVNLVLSIRKARKLVSTYLVSGKEFSPLTAREGVAPRILFSLNPHGTDSSRLASREHSFWCGLQIQNIPRGKAVKRTLKADEGFYLAECDLEQAESRDTAYIAGEETLIHNVEHSPDFHSANASSFFGIPFESIFSVELGKVLDKAIRDLAKRVNHGANYNMGANVLIQTMGEENIARAANLLNLPSQWGYKAIAEYLLAQFHKTYPDMKRVYYPAVVKEILSTHKLTSTAVHYETDVNIYDVAYEEQNGAWTRYCFGSPDTNKLHLNSYISHPPQSLNAQTLNKAFMDVFYNIAINPKYSDNFKLIAQIHDSILFQYRIGHEYLCDMVRQAMEIPLLIKGYDGKVRAFKVPAAVKSGTEKSGGVAKYWSETE